MQEQHSTVSKKLKNRLQDENERNVSVRSVETDPVVAFSQKSTINLRNVTKESQTLDTPANLANLTEEFNDLTRKMNHLKQALKHPFAGSDKKVGPTPINSSSQALQVANLQDILSAKQSIRDCIVALTFVDHFLNGNAELTSNYREKLRSIMTTKYDTNKTIVVEGLPNAYNSNSQRKHATDGAADTLEVFVKHNEKNGEISKNATKAEMSEPSPNKH